MAKRLAKLHQRYPALWLLLVCYASGVVLLFVVHVAGFAANRMAYATGRLQTTELYVDDFELINMEDTGNGLLTLNNDPQMLLIDTARRVENLQFDVQFEREPLVVNVFWAADGTDHSVRNMAYARPWNEQLFWLPPAGGQSLRIDPGFAAGNRLVVNRILINQPRPFYGFFIPTAGEVALLLVVPALAAAALGLLAQTGWLRTAKKVGERHG